MVSINTTYKLQVGYPDNRKTVGNILVAHETATPNAPAKNIAAYEHNGGYKSAYVHFAVDDKGAYQIGTPGYRVWGAGSVNSYAPVQIELCNFTDKAKGLKAYANYIALIREYAGYWKIPLTLDDSNKTDGVKSHLWCSKNYGGSDHTDPYGYLAQLGISKAQFAKDIKNGINNKPAPKPNPKPTEDEKVETTKNIVTISHVPNAEIPVYDKNGGRTKAKGYTNATKKTGNGVYILNGGKVTFYDGSVFIPIAYTHYAHAIIINYAKGYGVMSVDKDGKQINGSNKKFLAGTAWNWSKCVRIGSENFFQVANNEFVPAKYVQGGGYK